MPDMTARDAFVDELLAGAPPPERVAGVFDLGVLLDAVSRALSETGDSPLTQDTWHLHASAMGAVHAELLKQALPEERGDLWLEVCECTIEAKHGSSSLYAYRAALHRDGHFYGQFKKATRKDIEQELIESLTHRKQTHERTSTTWDASVRAVNICSHGHRVPGMEDKVRDCVAHELATLRAGKLSLATGPGQGTHKPKARL